jgi:hypothetical protein
MTDFATLPNDQLAAVTGGFSKTQIKTIEDNAVKYAEKQLHGGPVFLGDVNNAVKGPVFSPRNGVLVSTGDEANQQFFTGRVSIDRRGNPTGLKTL